MSAGEKKEWFFVDLPVTGYMEALALQRRVVTAKADGCLTGDVLIVLEHPSVFTLGKRGGQENLIVSERFLNDRNIDLVQVERGGDITWHGPGQVVAYPICDLGRAGLSVTEYVSALESVMIGAVAEYGVTADRNDKNRGVWVGNSKIGSVGIRLTRRISFHGIALNIEPDLTPFSWINPCGLKGVEMTSVAKETGMTVSVSTAREKLMTHFCSVFNAARRDVSLEVLEALI